MDTPTEDNLAVDNPTIDISTVPQKPKKKKSSGILGCDQCRRRKTKCDQAKPTCGPCIHAGLMECTSLLGKPPPPKRKKAQTEVGILEARLESIESAYSERLRHMESLLTKVLPASQVQELIHGNLGLGSSSVQATATTTTTKSKETTSTHYQRQGPAGVISTDSDFANVDSPKESVLSFIPYLDQGSTSRTPDPPVVPSYSRALKNNLDILEPKQSPRQEPVGSSKLSQHVAHSQSSASPNAPAFTSSDSFPLDESESDDSSDFDELAATMDKLRLFDASFYFGKGTMMFSHTDTEKFWDEEISFDVHEAPDIDIPPEALVMPPLDVIDALFDIYYSHYYVFMPMIQKAALLQALEDRHEPQSIFLLNSVFMAAAVTGECIHPSCYSIVGDIKSMGTPFFERARLVLDYCLGIPRVSTVQGLMMLSQYPKIVGIGHHFIQQAILMAMELGLHRKCDRWIPDKQVQETRKRVFWCVYAQDSSTASVTGRRPLIDNSEIDVPLVDPNATEGELEYSNTLFLLHLCKLWRIYRNVKQFVFNAEDIQGMASGPGSLPKNYEQQLIQWQLQLPAALRFSFELDPCDPLAKYNARAGIAQMLYESTLILLHKPFMSLSSDSSKRVSSRSLDICIKAASKITSIVKTLVKTHTKTYQITGIGECAIVNAMRILAMCIKSPDPNIRLGAKDDFDFLIRFFREFYASPQVIIDKDVFNCIMTFFDEFMHSVSGVSESTVHVCASAIKSMAIAKRNKIALRRTSTDGQEPRRPLTAGGDTRNLSRLVKIGREERARTRVYSPSSQSSKGSKTGSGGHRKRHSHMPHEEPHRSGTSLFTPFTQENHNGFMSTSDPMTAEPQESSEMYQNWGKVQKVCQYVSPFGGPAVMESLSQYQTSSAILSQPPSSSAIPQTTHLSDPADDVFQVFHPQQQQQQQQEQDQHNQQQLQQHEEYQLLQQQQLFLQHQQRQQVALEQQGQMDRSQGLFDGSANQPVPTFDVLTPSFWGDFTGVDGMANTVPRALGQSVLLGGPTIPSGMFDVMNPPTANPGDLYGTLGAQHLQHSAEQQHRPISLGGNSAQMKPDSRGKSIGEADNNLSTDHIQVLLEQTLAGDTQPNHPNIPQSDPSCGQAPRNTSKYMSGCDHQTNESWPQTPILAVAKAPMEIPPFQCSSPRGESTSQEQVFRDVGKTIVEQCVKGYNGTIFAYGQTGSGKTYTMQGPSNMTSLGKHEYRGIIPRCLEYLFDLIAKEEQMVSSVKYLCKASYIEIYNEMIYDLLDNSTTARATREDIKRGVYVDGVTEESIHNPEDAYKLFEQGAANRHVSATAMNRESSRSHTVLTLTIQSMTLVDGINHIRESRFNLVDLAGSERQKLANTEGLRLKEAGNINKSLLCLGSVINALGEIAGGHSRHVHYRDSRLTFLLKDSLGGNSNTFIVANVSPSALCYQESLSTLRFAQRAKMIRNKAVVNEDIQGNVNELRAEIQRLKAELGLKQAAGGNNTSMANMLLVETLAKLRAEQEEHMAMAQKGFMLDDACKAREKQIQSAQLIIKFKESALVSYRKGVTSAAVEAEKGALQEEVAQLRKQLDFHPEVLKVKAENLSLREMLTKLERYQSGLEDFEEKQKKDKEYLYNLSGKILELEHENETLRTKLGSATPKTENEDVDFVRIEGIDDLMQESPPKIRDADRRFSSDMKSLLQRVNKNRKAEYRRLSGNFGKPDPVLLDGDDRNVVGSPLSGNSTPMSKPSGASALGVNLSDSLSAHSAMHSDDSVEMTLLKRDVDRLKDENSVLVDEKGVLEKDYSDAQFQLITMEKCLEQATNQAEQLGRNLQSSRHALALMEQEATAKVSDLNKEMQEQVDLMEKMRVASILVEEERDRLQETLRDVEQQYKAVNKELDDTRQRLLENQKEYDHQVEYNMKRINEFQEKESKWDETKAELSKAKDDIEKLLEQQKVEATSTRSQLEKEHQTLLENHEALGAGKSKLEDMLTALEQELSTLRAASSDASKEHEKKEQQQLQQHETALKAEQELKAALEAELKSAQDKFMTLEAEFQAVKEAMDSSMEEADKILQEREQQLEDQIKALKLMHTQDLEEHRAQAQTENQFLIEAHQKKLEELTADARKQDQQLCELQDSFTEAVKTGEEALEAKQTVIEEMKSTKELSATLCQESEKLKQEKDRLAAEVESMSSKYLEMEATLEEQKQALSKMSQELEQEKSRLTSQVESLSSEGELKSAENLALEAALEEQKQALNEVSVKLQQEKSRLTSQIETISSKNLALETTLEEQKQELSKVSLELKQELWEKERLKTTRNELREKVSEMARKVGEVEQKLDQARDSNRSSEMEYRTVQDELEYQLSKARNDLAVKTNENMLNEEYKRKFRELRAQFADLGPAITERQQQGFHERELKRTMELEKAREELVRSQTRTVQLEANVALAQEMNEQLLNDSKASTLKIAEEMEKRLQDVEIQRQTAEREVEQALETVQQKTAQLQQLEEQAIHNKERMGALEEELNEERVKVERLEATLLEGKAILEEQEATEKELLIQETKRKLKEEQLLAQRQLLMKMKEEQQTLVQQQVERRDKTRALFEGLATENGKLMEQVRDLGLVNENIMKHQNPKQKLQYHVKIKQENNELRIENQRLMFRAIELEEKLGNKENVESLRKQVWEMHGESPYQSSMDLGPESNAEATSTRMEMVKGLAEEMPIVRSNSGSPSPSSETSASSISGPSAPRKVADEVSSHPVAARRGHAPAAAVSHKRKAAPNDPPSIVSQPFSRKRQAGSVPPQSVSSSETRSKTGPFSTVAATSVSSAASGDTTAEVPLGPRARAKAAADAALAASKFTRAQSAKPASRPTSNPSHPISRVSRTPNQRAPSAPPSSSRAVGHDDRLRGPRSGGAVTKPRMGAPGPSSATKGPNNAAIQRGMSVDPAIGSASAQRALLREARLEAAKAPTIAAISRKGLIDPSDSQVNTRGASQEPSRSNLPASSAPSKPCPESSTAPSTHSTENVLVPTTDSSD
ncbi:Kinesin-like protein kif15 [Mortierella hygrophila]|uniref:Kinesin-like protein kif15 n=1 Tax=Mortierella hygrophila TaxID=979708 RepID=A0A9P6FHM1_9FUNG|nr:Kinesin-like protein kif15 [Mortierella hygrophila]